jgi:hypothetical protein
MGEGILIYGKIVCEIFEKKERGFLKNEKNEYAKKGVFWAKKWGAISRQLEAN